METWHVELQGDSFDLEEFPNLFPIGGEVYFAREGEKVFMSADKMNECAQPQEVKDIAEELMNKIYPIARLHQENLVRPTLGVVWREDGEGARHGYALLSANISGRGKLSAQPSPDTATTQHTDAQVLFATLQKYPRLQTVIGILGLQEVNISQLYRCFEELEQHLKTVSGKGIWQNGLCSEKKQKLFKRTANTWMPNDGHARHYSGHDKPPDNPMSLEDAKEFIRELAKKTLEKFAS